MLYPSIFGENLFDDFFRFPDFGRDVEKKLYGKHAAQVMKTDVHEHDDHYEIVIDLPGFGEKKHASVSVGEAFSGTHEMPEQESELAARIAQERGCAVLAVQGCTDGIEALSGLDYETLDGGARLYEVPAEVMSGIMDAWQTAYPMQVYAPQEASAADSGNACILLLP